MFERAVAAAPQDPRSWLGYAEFYEHASRPDLATGVIERGLQKSPQDRDLRTQLAKLMSNDQISCHKIGDRLSAWNAEDPGHPPYLRYQGICSMVQGEASAALSVFLRELQVNRNDASAYYNLGLAYKVLGESGRARGAFAIATFLKPNDTAYAAEYRGLGLFSPVVPDVVPEGFWRAMTEWAPYSQSRYVSPQVVPPKGSGQFDGLTIAGGILTSLGVVSTSAAYFATDELDHPAVYLSLGATGVGAAMMIWGWKSAQTSVAVAPTEGGALATYQTSF